jgi:hypothetical protein
MFILKYRYELSERKQKDLTEETVGLFTRRWMRIQHIYLSLYIQPRKHKDIVSTCFLSPILSSAGSRSPSKRQWDRRFAVSIIGSPHHVKDASSLHQFVLVYGILPIASSLDLFLYGRKRIRAKDTPGRCCESMTRHRAFVSSRETQVSLLLVQCRL